MNILVTGGAGFIGGHLCRLLIKEGHKVIAVDDLSNACVDNISDIIDIQNFKLIEGDITDTEVLDDIFQKYHFDIIYHLASNTSVRISQENVFVDLNKTLESTFVTLQFAAKYGVKKFVFTSSSTVYGISDKPFTEETPLKPISVYGASKLASEAYVNAFCSCNNIQSWVIRLCNVIGDDIHHGIIGDIKRQLLQGKGNLNLLGTGNQEKPFLYVDDALDGIQYVVKHAKEQSNLYLVGNEDTISIRKIAELATNGKGWSFQFNNATKAWIGDVEQYSYNIDKVKALGWKPKYDSAQAIIKSLQQI